MRILNLALAACCCEGLVVTRHRRRAVTTVGAFDENDSFFGSSVRPQRLEQLVSSNSVLIYTQVAEDVTVGDVDVDDILFSGSVIRQALNA